MKFFAPFSALLCALSLGVGAAPIENEKTDLIARVPAPVTVETDAYKYFKGLKSDITPGTNYEFTMKSPFDSTESNPQALALTEALGYKHIYLLWVQVTKTDKTTPAGPKKGLVTTTMDVNAWSFDMVGTSTVESQKYLFKQSVTDGKTVTFVKTTKKTDGQLADEGKAYVEAHPTYSYSLPGTPTENNCGTYVTDLINYS